MSAESIPLPPELLVDEPPISDADIDRYLAGAEEYEPGEGPAEGPVARWVIDGTGSAAWSMAKLSGIASELATLSEQAQEWRDRIDAWFDQRAKPLKRHAEFFEGHLADYALRVREASGDEIKTITLPTGVVKTTGHKAAVTVEDAEKFVAWARGLDPEDYQTVVLVKEQPIVSGLRAMIQIMEVAQIVTLSCGCAAITTVEGRLKRVGDEWADNVTGRVWLGDAVECPSCGDDALVARIDSSYLEAQHPSLGDVPGLGVEPERVSAKVVPSV